MRIVAIMLMAGAAWAQQMPDPNFDAHVDQPAYRSQHPRVSIDEAHRNFHTADGRYKPFAELLRNDGYEVVAGKQPFSAKSLQPIRVLVIANALGEGANAGTNTSPPAFTPAECSAVRDWVRGGGSLLLISDHTPFGMAAEEMARAFGVRFGKGFVSAQDAKYIEGNPTVLVFSRENGLLQDHAITRGRAAGERIDRVVAFTGQSLGVPEGASVLMKLADEAREAPARGAQSVPVSGAQGLAMQFGSGRLVVLGEAAMMSAQVLKRRGSPDFRMGMNVPGNDDRQFALNVLHWLSGALSPE